MNQPPKLLDQLRNAIRLKHYPAFGTETADVSWAKRYISPQGQPWDSGWNK